MSQDPYAQVESEKLLAAIAANPTIGISEPTLWKGGLENILPLVRLLQHKCGFPEKHYQVKFNADVNALRLSDYTTRHACEPGDYFWLVGEVIRGGDLDEYARDKALLP